MIILSINLSSQPWIKGKVEAAKLRELVEVTEQPASRAAIKELQAPRPWPGCPEPWVSGGRAETLNTYTLSITCHTTAFVKQRKFPLP